MTEREWVGENVTEQEWLACHSLQQMPYDLDYCFGRCGLLFAAACCRTVWHLLPDDPGRAAILAAEGHADGLMPKVELEAVEQRAFEMAEAMAGVLPVH